jgi:hypothetical protein
MAICLIMENPDQTPEQAQQVLALVRESGPVPPEGARLMFAGPANPGMRVISIWNSEAAIEQFFQERLGPAQREVGVTYENVKRTVFELTTLVAGDLTDAAQPA